ncbi:MAG TPA: nicotinate phosphoribosyltransferase [Stellaceae bacterium]|nr:nicotinate phosphoribosyltransferase [Stellaceae bacterium]
MSEADFMGQPPSALLTDLYQLNMLEAYLDRGMTDIAVFEFFFRKLPSRRGFLMAAGLEEALSCIEHLRFSSEELAWLRDTGRFRARLIDYLANFRFTGDVHAMPEGTVFFADEPILRVTAPLPEAQLLETRLINILHFQTLIASKAARMVLAAPGKLLVDFGLRRAHGAEAGLMAARASYIAGFAGTATLLAEKLYGIPAFGTMAHSFIQAHDDEMIAFEHFAHSRPRHLTLLIDTYDTEAAARKVVDLAPRLARDGISVEAVRLDSGDLIALSRSVRSILDAGALRDVAIFASGGLDEDALLAIGQAGAPIDGFGVGTSLTTSSDVAALDCAYKLQEYAGVARRKRSAGKATWPGRKQVWRRSEPVGHMVEDTVALEDNDGIGQPLIEPVMAEGRRIGGSPSLAEIRAVAAKNLAQLPEGMRQLQEEVLYPVQIADSLVRLAAECDRRTAGRDGP